MTASRRLTDTQIMLIAALGVLLGNIANYLPTSAAWQIPAGLLGFAVSAYAIFCMWKAGWMKIDIQLRRKR